jgi:hypothetical protein
MKEVQDVISQKIELFINTALKMLFLYIFESVLIAIQIDHSVARDYTEELLV